MSKGKPSLASYGPPLRSRPGHVVASLLGLRGTRLHYRWFRLRRRFARTERWPDDGVDYTGWTARLLTPVGRVLAAGIEGTVIGYSQQRQGKFWTVRFVGVTEFDETDFWTTLPAPGKVELTRPAAA